MIISDRRKSTESSHSYKHSPKNGSDGSRRKSLQIKPHADSTTDGLSSDDNEIAENEAEIQKLLQQTRNHLEKTEALRIRSHLLRPEDYVRPLIRSVKSGFSSLIEFVLPAMPTNDPDRNMKALVLVAVLYIIMLLIGFLLLRSYFYVT